MAIKVGATTGNWNTAATWDSVTNSPTIHASTNLTVGAGGILSATFTAPSLTDACTGALAFGVTNSSATTITLTLQEDAGAGFADTAATVTVTLADFATVGGQMMWICFRFATPYVFTTITANKYRFKITRDAGSPTFAADSGGTTFSCVVTDNRAGVPAATDNVIVTGLNGTTEKTITVDANSSIGAGSAQSVGTSTTFRNVFNYAVVVTHDGILSISTAGSITLTVLGSIIAHLEGEIRIGTVASPVPAGTTCKISFNENSVNGNFGLAVYRSGKLVIQGASLTYTKTNYASGAGTAASPLIVADSVDWTVGDFLMFTSTGATGSPYNEVEYKYIITKNSATSYVISNTAGGAEAALANARTTSGHVVNMTRNAGIDTTNSSYGFTALLDNVTSTTDIDWAFFTNNAAATSLGFSLSTVTSSTGIDNTVFYNAIGVNFVITITSSPFLNFSGLVLAHVVSGAGINNLSNNITFTNLILADTYLEGFDMNGCFSLILNDLIINACNKSNGSQQGAIRIFATSSFQINGCDIQANRAAAFNVRLSTSGRVIMGAIGNVATNIVAYLPAITTKQDITFDSCSFGSDTLVSGYTNLVDGSLISFHGYNGSNENHAWYTPYGSARSAGVGLADTTVRTAGSLAVRIAPENSTNGFTWSFYVRVQPSSAASIYGFIKKNSAFATDDVVVTLYLPGSTSPDATTTMPDDTEWNIFSLAASYAGTVDAFARVDIVAKTATPAAYCYVDDILNGTNPIIALDAWLDGKPSPIMFEQLGDAAAVWAVQRSVATTSGTMGQVMNADFSAMELDGSVYRFTTNALEQTPSGGSAPTVEEIRTEIDDNSTQLAAIKTKTDNLPASPAAVGSAMNLASGAITAAVIATDAIDADAIATDAVTEIQNGLALSGGQMSLTAAAIDAILDELLSGHTTAGSLGAEITVIRQFLKNRMKHQDSTVTLYADDGSTPLLTWNVKDKIGVAIDADNYDENVPAERTAAA